MPNVALKPSEVAIIVTRRVGRPESPRMPCGWKCGAKLNATEMRKHFTDCPKRPVARLVTCPECGQSKTSTFYRTKFCSNRCAWRARKRIARERQKAAE